LINQDKVQQSSSQSCLNDRIFNYNPLSSARIVSIDDPVDILAFLKSVKTKKKEETEISLENENAGKRVNFQFIILYLQHV